MIDVNCPACDRAYRVGDDKAGKRFRCKGCESVVTIPDDVEFDDFGSSYDEPLASNPRHDDFDDAYAPSPRGGGGGSRTRRRKSVKKKSASGSKVGIVIGAAVGGVAVVAIVVVGIVFAVKNLGGSAYAQHEKMAEETLGYLEEIASAMESVQDRQSARAAAVRINAVCDKLDDWSKRYKQLPKITKRDDDKLLAKFQPKLDAVSARIKATAFNAGRVGGREPSFRAAIKRLEQVGRTMKQVGRGF